MPDFVDIAFYVLSAVAILAALGVVLVRDLFRSAILLAVVFLAVAGFFVLMSAEFLAVVQVLIYVGAISILFIFGIMLTPNVKEGNRANRLQIPAAMVAALLLVGLVAAAVMTEWRLIPDTATEMVDAAQTRAVAGAGGQTGVGVGGGPVDAASTDGLAELLVGSYVVPFEAVSLLLLAALIGGLALARSRRG